MTGALNKKDKIVLISFTLTIVIIGIIILVFSFKTVDDKRYIMLQTSANHLIKDKKFEEAINVLNEMKIINRNDEIIERTIEDIKSSTIVRDEINANNINRFDNDNLVKYVASNRVSTKVDKLVIDENTTNNKDKNSKEDKNNKDDDGFLSQIMDNIKNSTNNFFNLFK